jgi:recombinational DNA repair protein RecR
MKDRNFYLWNVSPKKKIRKFEAELEELKVQLEELYNDFSIDKVSDVNNIQRKIYVAKRKISNLQSGLPSHGDIEYTNTFNLYTEDL